MALFAANSLCARAYVCEFAIGIKVFGNLVRELHCFCLCRCLSRCHCLCLGRRCLFLVGQCCVPYFAFVRFFSFCKLPREISKLACAQK